MSTNLAIDQELLKKAKAVGHHKTKKGAVNAALKEYIEHREQLKILSMFDKVGFFRFGNSQPVPADIDRCLEFTGT